MKRIEVPAPRSQEGYALQDVAEPNLYRDLFPYSQVPKIAFDGKAVPMNPPMDIWITDTTFRDGQQARPPYTIEQVVALYGFLHRLGGPRGVIRQSEFFLYTDRDKEAVRRCLEKGYEFPEVTGWIRAVKEDFKLVQSMGLKETGILTSCSDYHVFLKLRKTRKEAVRGYLEVVDAALEAGIIPRCHLEDVTRADVFGFVVPFVRELMKRARQAEIPVKVRLCDTLGYGITHEGAALPRSVQKLVHAMTEEAEVPSEWLEWHGHNDFFKVLGNASAAWLYGASANNGTLLGLGERTGNTPLEGLVFEYLGLKGEAHGLHPEVLTEIAEYYRREIGVEIPANHPFLGSDFNVTRAGIHADGLTKSEEIYNIFDTERILNRPVKVGITDKSGLAGIVYWIHQRGGTVPKDHAGVQAIKAWVDAQYLSGRTTGISDAEMETLLAQHIPELIRPPAAVSA